MYIILLSSLSHFLQQSVHLSFLAGPLLSHYSVMTEEVSGAVAKNTAEEEVDTTVNTFASPTNVDTQPVVATNTLEDQDKENDPSNNEHTNAANERNEAATKMQAQVLATPSKEDSTFTFSEDCGGRGLRRMVTWADGTAAPQEVDIAVSIPRFKKLKAGYHVFSIEVWQEGRAWTVRRRYSQFLEFNNELLDEALVKPQLVPALPPKYIFHMRHFSKRYFRVLPPGGLL